MTVAQTNIKASHHHSQIYPIGDGAKKTTLAIRYIPGPLPQENRQQGNTHAFFTEPSYPMANNVSVRYIPPTQPLWLPPQVLPAVTPVSVHDEVDRLDVHSFNDAAYGACGHDDDPETGTSRIIVPEQFEDIRSLFFYTRLAARLAKDDALLFQPVALPNGCLTLRESKRANYYKRLCDAPLLSDVSDWLPRKVLHPRTELMLSSLERQQWRGYRPHDYLPDGRTAAEHCNAWLASFRVEVNQPSMAKKIEEWDLQAKELYISAVEYVKSLFEYGCARKLVLRLDLGVRAEYQDTLHVFKMRDALQQLLKNTAHNSLFAHMEGYLWRLEYTHDKSYHYHLILFFDGGKVQQDEVLVDQIGAYWVKMITKGQGTYWNCNRDVSKYKRRGIGMINWNDTQKLQCLLEDVLPYLTYVDKDIRLRITEDAKALGYEGDVRVRTFGRGTILKEKATNRGRPRRDSLDFNDEASVADVLGTKPDCKTAD